MLVFKAIWFHISSLPFFAEDLEGAKSDYAKVKEELDSTMQELNEMWDENRLAVYFQWQSSFVGFKLCKLGVMDKQDSLILFYR